MLEYLPTSIVSRHNRSLGPIVYKGNATEYFLPRSISVEYLFPCTVVDTSYEDSEDQDWNYYSPSVVVIVDEEVVQTEKTSQGQR